MAPSVPYPGFDTECARDLGKASVLLSGSVAHVRLGWLGVASSAVCGGCAGAGLDSAVSWLACGLCLIMRVLLTGLLLPAFAGRLAFVASSWLLLVGLLFACVA